MTERKKLATAPKVLLGLVIGLVISYGAFVYWYNASGQAGKDHAQQNVQTPQEGSSPESSTTQTVTTVPPPPPKVTCKDVTSYDYNWNNDVLCTNPDGSMFYTNYAGADKYGYNFP